MNGWILAPVGLVVWLVVGLGVALLIGPVLRECSVALEEADASLAEGVAQPVDSR